MLAIDIPGFGFVGAEHLVTDFTGTLSVDGKLLAGVKKHLQVLSEILKIHIVTSDTFGTALIGIAVLEGEGCAADAMKGADILVRSIGEGLNLLLHPDRLKATLRF